MAGSNFASRVLGGEETSPEEWRQHLREAHDRLPGMTAAVFSHHTTQDGRTSYELLAERVGAAAQNLNRPVDVLDLACGDGYLIEVCLHQSGGVIGTIAGIDMSAGELGLARQRLEGTIARVQSGLAQSLPMAPDSVDVVLCHAAFMLIVPIEPAVLELARILRPGGTFSAVVGSTLASAHPSDRGNVEEARALWEGIRATLQAFWLEEFPRLQIDGRLGDSRAMTSEGWRELFTPETGYTGDVDEQHFEVLIRDSAEGLWAFLKETYLAGMLDAPMRERLRSRVTAVLAGHEHPSGTLTMAFPQQQLSVRKR